MSKTVNIIKNRLSLRKPQYESLVVLDELIEVLELKKEYDLEVETEKVKNKYKTFSDFERDFPSLCFALATGVGKTRLMGAFIAYLYLNKKIKNFFIVAPNLTVYNKLIDDFGNSTSEKYVFRGISEFVSYPPNIVTGDNYERITSGQIGLSDITINIFNISKINSDVKNPTSKNEKGKAPKIKRLSEYIGQSYFDYLASLEDLVVVMDESHHYRAEKGLQALNELNPILGLEVTATPQIEKGKKTISFKNVVYEYSLAKALNDGEYVKIPAAATRKNLNIAGYTDEEMDRLKLDDGIRIHEETKVEIELYSKSNNKKYVKPFVLVVAKDTTHSGELKKYIQSDEFFNGYYKDKVIEVNSNQKGKEKDENIQKLLELEKEDNKIEIVIHVDMLKEGWDVRNLYTIIPLRAATSKTLREQTIGRGLRLPYGERTGNVKVDTLTIVAHDKFTELVEEANDPNSIIKKIRTIDEGEEALEEKKEILTSTGTVDAKLKEEEENLKNIQDISEREQKTKALIIKKKIFEKMNSQISSENSETEILKEEVKNKVVKGIYNEVKEEIGQDVEVKIEDIEAIYEIMVQEYMQNIINIPRIIIQPTEEVICGFEDFELDTSNINYQPLKEEIIRKSLVDGSIDEINIKSENSGEEPNENIILAELLSEKYSKIDYERDAELLYKLVSQVLAKFESYLEEIEIRDVVKKYKNKIADLIYSQMNNNFFIDVPNYEKPKVYEFTRIEPHNLTKIESDKVHNFRETLQTSLIKQSIFNGFSKAYHNLYKFDSKTEKDFAIILEDDTKVLKWLRPAANQFNIIWNSEGKKYEPDFVVETENAIFLVETKMEKEMDSLEVRSKEKAALEFCKNATEYNLKNGQKEWRYLIIPHTEVKQENNLEYFISTCERKLRK